MTEYITPEALATDMRNIRIIIQREIENIDRAVSLAKDNMELRMQVAERAVELARTLMEDRMSGFPAQFVKKGEIELSLATLMADVKVTMKEIADLREYKATMEGKASQTSFLITLAIALTSFVLSAIALILRAYRV